MQIINWLINQDISLHPNDAIIIIHAIKSKLSILQIKFLFEMKELTQF